MVSCSHPSFHSSYHSSESVHVSHAGECHVSEPYGVMHGAPGRPEVGCAPGVSMTRDPTDRYWIMRIPVMVHGRQVSTSSCAVADGEGEPMPIGAKLAVLLCALLLAVCLYGAVRSTDA